MNISRCSPYKCIRNQKVDQCQARFIICANLVEITSPMLHNKPIGLLFLRIRYLKGLYHIWVWCMLLYVHSSIAIILMGNRELIALLNLCSWCLVMVEQLFLAVPRGCLQFVIVVFPDHTHLLFLTFETIYSHCLINISSANNDFCFNSIPKVNFSKKIPFKCIRKQI